MSGITTLCFAASYAVALGLEIARLAWRSRLRGALAVGFAAAGVIAETLYLGYRAATAESVPLSSAYEWYLLAAWTMAAVYVYLALLHPGVASGIFVLPLALALVAAAQFASKQSVAEKSAADVWVTIHLTFWLLGAVAVIVGFATGVMYLMQAHRLKQKLPPLAGLRLPNLEWLERANSRAILISVLMAAAGLVSGVVLNLVKHKLPWSDATIWRSIGLFGWLLAAAVFSAIYRPARRGRKVAYLTVASFVFLAIFLAAQLIGRSEHSAGVAEVGGRRSEVGGRRSEVGGQRAEVGGQKLEVRGRVAGAGPQGSPGEVPDDIPLLGQRESDEQWHFTGVSAAPPTPATLATARTACPTDARAEAHATGTLRSPISDLRFLTSDLRPLASDLRPLSSARSLTVAALSDFRPLASDLDGSGEPSHEVPA